jgi:hypothetical protein
MLCENHIYTVNGNSEITVTVINGNKYVTLVDNLMWHIMSCTLLKSKSLTLILFNTNWYICFH